MEIGEPSLEKTDITAHDTALLSKFFAYFQNMSNFSPVMHILKIRKKMHNEEKEENYD